MISPEAWKVVTGETPIVASDGIARSATPLIYHWYRQWLQSRCGRAITMSGIPLTPTFQWWSRGTINGRTMIDVAQELEPVMLEAAAEAVDKHDESRGPLIAWMKLVIDRRLLRGFERWIDESSNASSTGAWHVSLDALEELDDLPIITTYPDEVDVDPVDKELVGTALKGLTHAEQKALQMFANGDSYKMIARTMELSGGTAARRIVQRARDKALLALGES